MILYYLDFISSGHGQRDIDEPTSFDGAEFIIEQDENRLGRDVSGVVGSASKIRLDAMLNHCIDIIQFNYDKFGFEAIVKFGVRIDEDRTIIGQIDFNTYESDGKSYCEFAVTEVGERALIKRRIDTNTNLLAFKTLDDEDITPVEIVPVFRPAKPVINISKWETPAGGGQSDTLAGLGGEGNNIFKYFNFANVVTQYDINNTLSYIQGNGSQSDFGYLEAEENLKNVRVKITNLSYDLAGTGSGEGNFRLRWYVGVDSDFDGGFGPTGSTSIISENIINNGDFSGTNESYTIEIPFIERGKKLYLYFVTLTASQSNSHLFGLVSTISSMNVEITATEVGYSTIIYMARLIDAMRYNVKSASGLNISAPRWDFGGELYDQYITTQALMRNLTDKPFNISFKDIVEKYLPEVNGDYQLQEDGTVFFGIEADFYRDFMMESFRQEEMTNDFGQPQGQIDEFVKSVNQRLSINTFELAYEHYSSQRENEEANTYDLVHGGLAYLLKNMLVNGKKEVKIGFIRDAFLWEEAGRKAYRLKENTATSDDDKIFIGDVVPFNDAERFITETSTVQHKAVDNDTLVLNNDQSFSWLQLGISGGSPFIINNGDNQGAYIVTAVNDLELTLLATNNPENIAEFNTNYTYFVSPLVTTLKLRTNEGFDLIENLEEGDSYINLPWTTKRNTVNYYGSFLASCLLRTENKVIKNTLYNNNPDAVTQYEGGETMTEGADFIPSNPILDIDMVKVTLLMTLNKFLELRAKIRQENGYIETFDSNGLPIRGYIRKGVFTLLSKGQYSPNDILGQMEADLEVKYELVLMEIFGVGDNSITINGTLQATDFDYRIDDFEKLHIFDQNGKQMFVPVPYNRVKVNNAQQAGSVFEMAQWLNALKT